MAMVQSDTRERARHSRVVDAAVRSARTLLLGLMPLVLAACQSIPDVSAWNQATRDVTAAASGGFQAATDLHADIGQRLGADPALADAARRYNAVAASLAARTADYEILFGAIADYAGALAAISQASDRSDKTVAAVAGSVNQLLGAVGGTALAGAGVELVGAVASEVIKIQAARDFAEAVERADPVVARIADLLTADLADLGRTVGDSKAVALRVAIELPLLDRLAYRRALERRRADLQALVRGVVAPASAQPTASVLDSRDLPELARVDQLLRDTDGWYLPLQSEIDQALKTRDTTLALTVQAGRAVAAWKSSHASLAAAVRERRLPESGRLAALAVRLRELAADLRKEK